MSGRAMRATISSRPRVHMQRLADPAARRAQRTGASAGPLSTALFLNRAHSGLVTFPTNYTID